MHDGLCPPTDSRREPATCSFATGHNTTDKKETRDVQQERKQQRTQRTRPGQRQWAQARRRHRQRARPRIECGSGSALGRGSRPPSARRSDSPWTPRWPPSARGAAGAATTTSKATSSSSRPTASSATAVGATRLAGDVTLRQVETVDTQTGEVKVASAYSAPVRVTVAGALPRTDIGVHPVGRGHPGRPRHGHQGGRDRRHEAGVQELRRPVRQRLLRRPAAG